MQDNKNTTQGEKAPLVSFIITHHNEPHQLLRECINSILSLSLSDRDREVLLIDDGSDLCPVDELADVSDKLTYLRQPCRGLSVARNVGLSLAKGTFVQFVDADDRLIRVPYERCLDIVRYKDPDIVMFLSSRTGQGDFPQDEPEPLSGSDYMRQNNLRASSCCYIFRRATLGPLRFTPGLLHEDEEFTPQLVLRAKRVFDTKATAYHYRRRPETITNTKSTRTRLRRLHDTESIILRLQDLLPSTPAADQEALSRRIAQLTADYLYNTMRLTRSEKALDRAIDRLAKRGLYPLPDKKYSPKYTYFRRMLSSKMMRKILCRIMN